MLTEMFSRLRAMRPGTRLAALLCAAAVACCLALPPVVFAVWDGMLFAGTHPRADAGQAEPLGDAARANPAACLLYNCAHLLGVDPARPSSAPDQWQARTPAGQDLADAKARCAAAVDSAAALGLLADADAARLRAALDGSGYLLTAQNGPAGLTAYSLAPGPVPEEQPADAGPAGALTLTLALTLTADGRPVYFSWQDSGRTGDAAGTGSLLAPALALLGVDEFTDWQPVDWGGRLPGAGEAAYSPAAQLYVSVNTGGGLTVGAASMTPEQFAALLD